MRNHTDKDFMDFNKINFLYWVKHGAFAILDQSLFAVANFVVNILLARWLSPYEYGAFAIAYSVFYLLGNIYMAVLVEPMLVLGGGKYNKMLYEYIGSLIYLHFVLSAIITTIILVVGGAFWFFKLKALSQALAGLGVAAPLILLLWLLRRTFYLLSQPQWAAIGGGGQILLMLIFIYILYKMQCLSSFSALVTIGIANALISLGYILLLLYKGKLFLNNNISIKIIIKDHWNYGIWTIGAAIIWWALFNVQYLILSWFDSLTSTAVLKAVTNLFLPGLQFTWAIHSFALPFLSRRFFRDGILGLKFAFKTILLVLLSGTFLYSLLLIVFGDWIIELLYGDKYSNYAYLVYVGSILPLISAILMAFGGIFRAMKYPRYIFWSYLIGGVTSIVVGIPLISFYSVLGAILSQIISLFVASVNLGIFLFILLRR